jgi:hypothetical protein
LLLALGVWLLAAGITGALTALAARGVGVTDVTAIVVAESTRCSLLRWWWSCARARARRWGSSVVASRTWVLRSPFAASRIW